MKLQQLFITLFFFSLQGISQEKDAIFWGGVGLNYDLNKRIKLKYKSQVRLFRNASTISSYYNEFSGDYKISKHWNAGATFRHSFRNEEPNYTREKRIALNVSHDVKIKPLDIKIKTRGRYQFDYDRLYIINDVLYPQMDHTFRLKSKITYEDGITKRLIPYAGGELFCPIRDVNAPFLSQFRLFGGITVDLPKRHEVTARYVFQQSLRGNRKRSHIYMIQYNYQLKIKSKKKK